MGIPELNLDGTIKRDNEEVHTYTATSSTSTFKPEEELERMRKFYQRELASKDFLIVGLFLFWMGSIVFFVLLAKYDILVIILTGVFWYWTFKLFKANILIDTKKERNNLTN